MNYEHCHEDHSCSTHADHSCSDACIVSAHRHCIHCDQILPLLGHYHHICPPDEYFLGAKVE